MILNRKRQYTYPYVSRLKCWDCDNQGNCYDPGTGLGLYSSLSTVER